MSGLQSHPRKCCNSDSLDSFFPSGYKGGDKSRKQGKVLRVGATWLLWLKSVIHRWWQRLGTELRLVSSWMDTWIGKERSSATWLPSKHSLLSCGIVNSDRSERRAGSPVQVLILHHTRQAECGFLLFSVYSRCWKYLFIFIFPKLGGIFEVMSMQTVICLQFYSTNRAGEFVRQTLGKTFLGHFNYMKTSMNECMNMRRTY